MEIGIVPFWLCASSEGNIPLFSCYEVVEHQRALWDLIQWYSGRDAPEVSLSLVVLCLVFHLFHLLDCVIYQCRECAFERRFNTHQRPLIVGWQNVVAFSISLRLVLFIMSCPFRGGVLLKVTICCPL